MDILNWIYVKTQNLIRTTPNNSKTDLIVLGAEVPFTKRGDGYQTYAMPLSDAVTSVCEENNQYKTSIFETYPYAILPSMLKTCTSVKQTGNGMFPLNEKLDGYKIGGAISLNNVLPNDLVYLGTLENTNTELPWKLTGSVTAFDDNFNNNLITALANGAYVTDTQTMLTVSSEMYILHDAYSTGIDFYLVWGASTSNTIIAEVTFEIEFLNADFVSGAPTFTVY